MAPNIQNLAEKRKKWVEANRENGFEDGIKRLLTDLYPDNAHFIYELLQNAEDAGASQVCFILNKDSMEFEHDGSRLFSIKDVDSITSIGVSTKKNDPTSIGKFGVGFKAVFAYTDTPEIHSGEFHFRIRDLVVPDLNNLSPCSLGAKRTRFLFPFDNPKKPKEHAFREIEKNLRQLTENTLLFLSNIRKIEYLLPDSTMGLLERRKQNGNRVEIIVQHPEQEEPTFAVFLRLEKVVDVHDEEAVLKSCRISVAFGMIENKVHDDDLAEKRSRKHIARWEIKPLDGRVSIYFPADKETSNLRFHVHAPFASTVARDSVRDCAANEELRDHLASLIGESMTTIRDQGLLTMGFLATLPNEKDNLSSFYKPIQDTLIRCFQSQNLTPMKQGGHAPASGIFRGPVQLSNLINDQDLATILGEDFSPPVWVANPPQRNQREDSFLSILEIKEWKTEDLVNALSSQPDLTENWLKEKSVEWHQGLYVLLGEYLAPYHDKYREAKLKKLQIIRISDGSYRIGRKCYFPNNGIEHDKLMPRVARGVYNSGRVEDQKKKSRDFLEKIGVREVGEAEQVEAILKDRYSQAAVDRDAFSPDVKDIKRFIALVENDFSTVGLFKDHFIFKLTDGKWAQPHQVYLDSPFSETGLAAYYEALDDAPQCWRLSDNYSTCGVSFAKIGEFAKKLGVIHELPITKVPCWSNPEWSYLRSDPGGYGYSSDDDYTVKWLDELLKIPTVELSQLVWLTMNSSGKHYLQAAYKKSDKGGYRYANSQLVHLLRKEAWVPQKSGEFLRPCDASQTDLPKGFAFDVGQKWLAAIEFGISAIKRSEEYSIQNNQAQQMGFVSVVEAEKMAKLANLCRENGKSLDDLIAQVIPDKERQRPSFPQKKVANPGHRQERFAEQISDAPKKEYEKRERSVRTTSGAIDPVTWLRNQYTNESGQMVCQICKEEMPFRKRNGKHYFEKKEVLSKIYLSKEHEAQYLALCPLCAARYKEFIENDKDAMADLKEKLVSVEDCDVPLKLGELETSIRFVETHYHDLKIILEEVGMTQGVS